jgi:hypothetical protein
MSERSTRRRLKSTINCAIAFVLVAVGGWFIHVYVLPLPIESLGGGIARYVYFICWLGTLIYLLSRALFDSLSRAWHIAVHLLGGLQLGGIGGYFFGGILGLFVGFVTGGFLGPVIYVLRRRAGRSQPPAERLGEAVVDEAQDQ